MIQFDHVSDSFCVKDGDKWLYFDSVLKAKDAVRQVKMKEAVKAERDRIVAWLREQEDIGFDRMLRADAPNSQRNYAAGAEAVKRCADLIKAGEHLK
jgi:hypothetical protein